MLNFHDAISLIALLVMAFLGIGYVSRSIQHNKILKITHQVALVTKVAWSEKFGNLMSVAKVWNQLATDLAALDVLNGTPKMYQLGLLKVYKDTG